MSPLADALFAGWEKDFTLVQWDQRGAGRTYGKSGPSIEPTMTIERMVQDGIEVAQFLAKHLNKKKIIIGRKFREGSPEPQFLLVGQLSCPVDTRLIRPSRSKRANKDQPSGE